MGFNLQAEWANVSAAPTLFLGSLLVVGGVIWLFLHFLYKVRIDGLKDSLKNGQDEVARLRSRLSEAPPPPSSGRPAPENGIASELASQKAQRRAIVEKGRNLATIFRDRRASGLPIMREANKEFREFLESRAEYPQIRPHLSTGYLRILKDRNTSPVDDEEGAYPKMAQWLLDEMDRLEREWGLL